MLIDHAYAGGTVVGRLAMPVYTYRQSFANSWRGVGIVAIAAELPHFLILGEWINVCWLFVGMGILKEGWRYGAAPQADTYSRAVITVIAGGIIMGVVLGHHPSWVVWVPLLCSGERWIWYAIGGVITGIAGIAGPLTIIGYELARVEWGPKPPKWLWWWWYPVHFAALFLFNLIFNE